MDYCSVVVSCLDSHSDGTHSGFIGGSVLMKKQIPLHFGWPELRVSNF